MKIADIQARLNKIGIDAGPVDGFYGKKTIKAVKVFQKINNLHIDGIPGAKTLSKMFPENSGVQPENVVPVDLVWLIEAIRLFGVTETPGVGSNVKILEWAEDLNLPYSGDEVPWCGLFIAHCMNTTLPDEPLPSNPLKARNWLNFGVKTQPTLGAIMVFSREGTGGNKGHVGLYMGENTESYRIIGGNQSDKVCFANISKIRLLGSFWPSVLALPQQSIKPTMVGGTLSWNEL